MGLDKSMLIDRRRCDASRALEVAYRRLFIVSHTTWSDNDWCIDWLELYPLSTQFINYNIYFLNHMNKQKETHTK